MEFRDKVFSWYIKYNTTNPAVSFKDIEDALNNEFRRPKYQA